MRPMPRIWAQWRMTNPMRDRLLLDARRIESIAEDMRHIARLASPVGEIIEKRQMPNSMTISKIRVPLGVVGVIYEARPNVTFDVFSLCLKTANACILKGGSDAIRTNTAAISIIRQALSQCGITPDAATLLGAGRQCAGCSAQGSRQGGRGDSAAAAPR